MNLRKIAKRQMRLSVGGPVDFLFTGVRSFMFMRWIWVGHHPPTEKPWPRGLNKPRGAR